MPKAIANKRYTGISYGMRVSMGSVGLKDIALGLAVSREIYLEPITDVEKARKRRFCPTI